MFNGALNFVVLWGQSFRVFRHPFLNKENINGWSDDTAPDLELTCWNTLIKLLYSHLSSLPPSFSSSVCKIEIVNNNLFRKGLRGQQFSNNSKNGWRTSLVVQWLRLPTPNAQGAQVPSLFRELNPTGHN